MDKFYVVTEVKEYGVFVLQEENTSNTYELVLEFHNIAEPKTGDWLLLPERIMDRTWDNFTQPYTYEGVSLPLIDQTLNNTQKCDLAELYSDNNRYLLKRLYG